MRLFLSMPRFSAVAAFMKFQSVAAALEVESTTLLDELV